MAFARKVTQYFSTANGAFIGSEKRDRVEEEERDAKARLADIYRREAIGAFEDYRELIKEKSSVK